MQQPADLEMGAAPPSPPRYTPESEGMIAVAPSNLEVVPKREDSVSPLSTSERSGSSSSTYIHELDATPPPPAASSNKGNFLRERRKDIITMFLFFLVMIIVVIVIVIIERRNNQQPQNNQTNPSPATPSPSTTHLPTTLPLDCPALSNTHQTITLGSENYTFNLTCGMDISNQGKNDILATIAYSLHDCLQACASYNVKEGSGGRDHGCVAIEFHKEFAWSVETTYGNCWLKNSTVGEKVYEGQEEEIVG
ncbi:hypothetical protein QBC38DRAFT_398704, partial [Podospora fimiseda]